MPFKKPIVIERGVKAGHWVMHVNGKPVVQTGVSKKGVPQLNISEAADAVPFEFKTLKAAEGLAFSIGYYKLKLGSFVDTYVEVRK